MAAAPLPDSAIRDARPATRPPLRLLSSPHDGGRAAAQVVRPSWREPSTTRRSRFSQLALLVVTATLLVALAAPIAALAGTDGAPAGSLVPGTTYVVGPGDTLASIAARLAPGTNPRPLVAKMAAETGSPAVVPGEHLVLP